MLRVVRLAVLSSLVGVGLQAANPVVLVNGYQGPSCVPSTSKPASAASFGNLETLLGQNGLTTAFFDNCVYAPNASLEDLGAAFGKFLAGLKNSDGSAVTQADVVAIDMGGLIVRAYLTGISTTGFTPPVDTKIGKAIFIGTPFFGSDVLAGLSSSSNQTPEMQLGSQFLNSLATWNQGWDDLRGVDALAIAGNGGATSNDDGVVPLTSAAPTFVFYYTSDQGHTRIIPYCHTNPSNFPATISCQSGAKFLDNVDDSSHLVYQLVSSFLADTADWTKIGYSPAQDPVLSTNGGVFATLRTADDKTVGLSQVSAVGADKTSYTFSSRFPQMFYRESMKAQTYQVTFGATDGSSPQSSYDISTGGVWPNLFKLFGPYITGVYGAGYVSSFSMAPGMFIAIFGSNLASKQAGPDVTLPTQLSDTQVFVNGKAIGLQYVDTGEIYAVLPTGILGLVTLQVVNSQGKHTINLMIEPAVPSLYYADPTSGDGIAYVFDANTGKAITSANPAQAGQTISFYGTGLGETSKSNGYDVANATITVTIGGIPAQVLFAGRIPDPNYPGQDEIDVLVPSGLTTGLNDVYVFANNRYSNLVLLPVK